MRDVRRCEQLHRKFQSSHRIRGIIRRWLDGDWPILFENDIANQLLELESALAACSWLVVKGQVEPVSHDVSREPGLRSLIKNDFLESKNLQPHDTLDRAQYSAGSPLSHPNRAAQRVIPWR